VGDWCTDQTAIMLESAGHVNVLEEPRLTRRFRSTVLQCLRGSHGFNRYASKIRSSCRTLMRWRCWEQEARRFEARSVTSAESPILAGSSRASVPLTCSKSQS